MSKLSFSGSLRPDYENIENLCDLTNTHLDTIFQKIVDLSNSWKDEGSSAHIDAFVALLNDILQRESGILTAAEEYFAEVKRNLKVFNVNLQEETLLHKTKSNYDLTQVPVSDGSVSFTEEEVVNAIDGITKEVSSLLNDIDGYNLDVKALANSSDDITGSVNAEVEKIRVAMRSMEEPINALQKRINEVSNEYKTRIGKLIK